MTGSPTLTNEGKVGRRRRLFFLVELCLLLIKIHSYVLHFLPRMLILHIFLYSSPSIGGSRGQKCCQIIG